MKNLRRGYLVSFVLVVSVVFLSCNREESDWSNASTRNSIEAYKEFVQKHPDGSMVEEAMLRIAALEEKEEWEEMLQENDIDGYRRFLEKWPNSSHGDEALRIVEEFERIQEAGRLAELAALEYFSFSQHPLTEGVTINNQELLKDSDLWGLPEKNRVGMITAQGLVPKAIFFAATAEKEEAFIFKVGDVELESLDAGIGFVFKDKWDRPYVVSGIGPKPEFRRGTVSLISGDVKLSEGLEMRILTGDDKVSREAAGVNPEQNETETYFKYGKGGWEIITTESD